MKPTQSILILLSLFLTFSFSEELRVEIIKRYDNGNKKLLVKYKGEGSDEVIVERITYGKNGETLKLEKLSENMKMVWEYYNNGQIWKETNYKDDKLDGKWTSYYYENGQIWKETNYKEGEESGEVTNYRENGQVRFDGNHKEGKRDVGWTYYYENGQIWFEGDYKDGWEDGTWTYYNEDGSIEKVEEYKDGELVE